MTAAPEKQLAKHLLKSYSELGVVGRPVKNVADTVKVSVAFALKDVVKVEENSISVAAWLKLKWQDPFLTWAPEQFGGVKSIALPARSVWRPDMVNYNDIHHNLAEQEGGMSTADVLVTSDGTVVWVPRAILKSDSSGFDEKGKMVCQFSLGSWVHDSAKVDVVFDNDTADFDMSLFKTSPCVEVVEHSANKVEKKYLDFPENFPTLNYTLGVRKVSAK